MRRRESRELLDAVEKLTAAIRELNDSLARLPEERPVVIG